jgi:predicted PP-loop superfamily ATPase
MPRVRESLKTTKTRLKAEQKQRTDRRVLELLNPRREEQEIFNDSEEADRLRLRHARLNRDKATQTDISSSFSCCCGVFVGVSLVVCLLVCLIVNKTNDRHRSA